MSTAATILQQVKITQQELFCKVKRFFTIVCPYKCGWHDFDCFCQSQNRRHRRRAQLENIVSMLSTTDGLEGRYCFPRSFKLPASSCRFFRVAFEIIFRLARSSGRTGGGEKEKMPRYSLSAKKGAWRPASNISCRLIFPRRAKLPVKLRIKTASSSLFCRDTTKMLSYYYSTEYLGRILVLVLF